MTSGCEHGGPCTHPDCPTGYAYYWASGRCFKLTSHPKPDISAAAVGGEIEQINLESMRKREADLARRAFNPDAAAAVGASPAMSDDAAIDAALDAYRFASHSHQGFLYGFRHVIRNLHKPPDDQVVWSIEERDGDDQGTDYERCHRAMTDELDRIALRHAIAAYQAAAPDGTAALKEAMEKIANTPVWTELTTNGLREHYTAIRATARAAHGGSNPDREEGK